MPNYRIQPDYQHGSAPRVGILLVNLGTPDAPTPGALRRYLKEFLSDPRVVEVPRIAWWPILNLIILNVRPRKSAEKYAAVWTGDGSPLKVHTERQARMLSGFLHARGLPGHEVAYAMRYGNPGVSLGLDGLVQKGCDRILVLPLYPQFAASTTGSTFDAVSDWGRNMRNLPAITFMRNFHDHPAYIQALAGSVIEHWAREGGKPDMLVMSFHGLPQYTLREGDPYHCECLKTGRLVGEALGLKREEYRVTFQSRFGQAQWLQPYTTDTLAELGRAGTGRVDIMCPGFVSDCLETLEEIAIEGKDTFKSSGGGKFNFIPCLNERDAWMHAMVSILAPSLKALERPPAPPEELKSARQRALALGAAQ
jgi:ferrochelatase